MVKLINFFRHNRRHREERRNSLYFDEAIIVWNIAVKEALTLGHIPSFVHLVGASLYRLRDADAKLLGELGVSVEDIRQWAVANLPPSRDSLNRRYEGNLDFEYTIKLGLNDLRVSRVRRPVKLAPENFQEHDHPSGEGIGVLKLDDSGGDVSLQLPLKSLFQFIEAIRADADPAESSVATLRRVLVGLWFTTEAQACLDGLGVQSN